MRSLRPVFATSDRAICLEPEMTMNKTQSIRAVTPIGVKAASQATVEELVHDVVTDLDRLTNSIAKMRNSANKVQMTTEAVKRAEEYPALKAEIDILTKQNEELQALVGLIREQANAWDNDQQPAARTLRGILEALRP